MSYEFTGTSLAAAFLLIWAFIGLTMLRDQLLVIRRERLEESGYVPRPKGMGAKRRNYRRRKISA